MVSVLFWILDFLPQYSLSCTFVTLCSALSLYRPLHICVCVCVCVCGWVYACHFLLSVFVFVFVCVCDCLADWLTDCVCLPEWNVSLISLLLLEGRRGGLYSVISASLWPPLSPPDVPGNTLAALTWRLLNTLSSDYSITTAKHFFVFRVRIPAAHAAVKPRVKGDKWLG